MLIRTQQTNGGPVAVQTNQIVYLRQITPQATGVVLGAKGFNEFAISVDLPLESLLAQITDQRFIRSIQTGGGPVAVNCRHIRYARSENGATVVVLGARGGDEFAISMDMPLESLMTA
jgi:hypothetical protein